MSEWPAHHRALSDHYAHHLAQGYFSSALAQYQRKMLPASQVKMSRLFPLQLGGGGAWRTHSVAFHTHQQRGDQRGATYQPQREPKTVGDGKGSHSASSAAVNVFFLFKTC